MLSLWESIHFVFVAEFRRSLVLDFGHVRVDIRQVCQGRVALSRHFRNHMPGHLVSKQKVTRFLVPATNRIDFVRWAWIWWCLYPCHWVEGGLL